ncbi:MAG: matrixin family metalloprotease [Armatimonadota bacterium]
MLRTTNRPSVLVLAAFITLNGFPLCGCGGGGGNGGDGDDDALPTPTPTVSATPTPTYPYKLNARASGTRGTIPFSSNYPDDAASFQTNSDSSFSYTEPSTRYYIGLEFVYYHGSTVTISVPATYGDRQFADWTRDGAAAGNSTALQLDPKTNRENNVVARYTSRLPAPDGSFYPNSFSTNAEPIIWDRSGPVKVSFVTQDGFTEDRKRIAVEGFEEWTKATGGIVQFTFLPDNSPEADVIVGFTVPTAPNPNPKVYLPEYEWRFPLGSFYTEAQTLWLQRTTSQGNVGATKRLILFFYQKISDNTILKIDAMHEMGHALGISGHSSDEKSRMHVTRQTQPYIFTDQESVRNSLLWEDDINMIETLYQQQGYDVPSRTFHRSRVQKKPSSGAKVIPVVID